ncbi:MAG TPA: hypothetical protein VJ437_00300 [Acidiferrobacterales bacterium]|nr:hypothetical protein [Acidiferrobacterales bacterium]
MPQLRSLRIRAALVPWLVLLLLLAQGLRLCVPAETTHGHEQHADVRLESVITSAADQHESQSHDGDLDVPLSALLKAFQNNPLFFALFAFVLFVLPTPRTRSGVWPEALAFRPPRGHCFSPPLRAPPR